MAFPTIAASTSSAQNGDVTSHTIVLPTGIGIGDLLIAMFTCDGNPPTFTWPAGWTSLVPATDRAGETRSEARYRIADGTEGTSITVTTSVAQQSAHQCLRIEGHGSSLNPPEGSFTTGTTALPDPPLKTTSVAKDYLWIEGFGADDDDAAATWVSSGYTALLQQTSGTGTGTCMISTGYKQENAISDNPATMTMAASEQWVAWTIAVHPGIEGIDDTVSVDKFYPGMDKPYESYPQILSY